MDHKTLIISVVIVTIAVVIGVIGLVSGSETEHAPIAPSTSAEAEALDLVLRDLKRNWKPTDKARILAEAVERADELRRPLVEMLSKQSGELLAEAIELAAILELREARQAIARLAEGGPERLRPAAILAAEQLEPWSPKQLGKFLQTGTPPVICAALEISSSRDDRPFVEIVSLFGHAAAQVRQAASNAIPAQISSEDQRALISLAGNATEDEAVYAIRAMGRTGIPPLVEAFLVEQIKDPVRSIRMAALDALTQKGSPLQQATTVWRFVREGSVDVMERAKSFVCLERTRSFEVFEIRDALPGLHPYLKYFAARCLVSAGERQGVGVRIDLVSKGTETRSRM